VAGTDQGVTAIQLDVKIPGLTLPQIKEILGRARKARLEILEIINKTLPAPRTELSEYAPKIELVKVPVDKIGEVIGPGGKVIKNIIATTGAMVDVEDDGSVAISGTSDEAVQKAVEWIKSLIRQVTPGEEFEGEVKRILPFGAFVEILPGKEGMVHVSKMAAGFVKDPNDVVTLGQKVKVKVVEIDDQGRINLTMLLNGETSEGGRGGEDRGAPRPPFRGPSRPPMRSSGFQDRRSGPPSRPYTPRSPQDATAPVSDLRSEHPLARQFRREKAAASTTRFKKTRHY
ncbi:MAG: S1 RNA-binding domain-containing protein, partial [Patescibacteria group bacterium]